MRHLNILMFLLIIFMPMGAQASRPMLIDPGTDFRHDHAGITVPIRLDGLWRGGAYEFNEVPKLDVGLQYVSDDQHEVISVYVFRLVVGTPEIWFDRALFGVLSNSKLGKVMPGPVERFAAPGATVNNGLRAIYDIEPGGPFRSTAVALVPLDGWLVTLRLSSASLDRDGLRDRLARVVQEISWPAFDHARLAQTMSKCAQPLPFSKEAKIAKADPSSSLIASALAQALANKSAEEPDEQASAKLDDTPVNWCRDSIRANGSGVYRMDESRERYLIAIGDSGLGMTVGPSLGQALMGKRAQWLPTLVQLDRQLLFTEYRSLPTPEQLFGLLENGQPVSSVTTWPEGGNMTITLPSG